MTDRCKTCGCTRGEVEVDARTLDLLDDFQTGRYRCCDIVRWADEQRLAWLDATDQDANEAWQMTETAPIPEQESAFVPVRTRRRPNWFGMA